MKRETGKDGCFPRFLISAPSSGSGKTLITCALLRILMRRGFSPQGFKCGPDFIDPMFHQKVLGIPSRNLDLFLQGREQIRKSLARAYDSGRTIGVMEGVMGFYDGISASSSEGSSYELGRETGTPTILVMDCKGMSRSILASLRGFSSDISAVLLNRLPASIAPEISAGIEKELGIPVLGYLPPFRKELFASRHLGLVLPDEIPGMLATVDEVADALEKSLKFDLLMQIAESAPDLSAVEAQEQDRTCRAGSRIRVGVAEDTAFCFYYEDNLELLKDYGAELVPFSPLRDRTLPDVTGLLLGGGYPELYAKELSENDQMLNAVRNAADNGMPMLAECGGFLYLNRTLTGMDGKCYPMAGVFDGDAFRTDRLTHFGYAEVFPSRENPYLKPGEHVRGHEFHYFDTTENGDLCVLRKPGGKSSWNGMRCKKNVLAGFAHLYYPSCEALIRRFIKLQEKG